MESQDKYCDWIMNRMKLGGLTADDIANHVDNCPTCKQVAKRRMGNYDLTEIAVNPEDIPTMMMIGIEGPFNLSQILFMARKEDKELVVMGNRSPAIKDPKVLVEEAQKFRTNPNLIIAFEKMPNKFDPFCLDPLVIVRRDFLLNNAKNMNVETLGELGFMLVMEAQKQSCEVSFIL